MSIERIKEGTYYEVEASCFDSEGEAALPTTIEYSLYCLTNGREIGTQLRSVPIGTTVSIFATADENAIINNRNEYERKQMTVVADRGLPTQTTETIEWMVKNIRGTR
jgi:hypothetical protein